MVMTKVKSQSGVNFSKNEATKGSILRWKQIQVGHLNYHVKLGDLLSMILSSTELEV